MKWDPDGQRLASGSYDTIIRIWKVLPAFRRASAGSEEKCECADVRPPSCRRLPALSVVMARLLISRGVFTSLVPRRTSIHKTSRYDKLIYHHSHHFGKRCAVLDFSLHEFRSSVQFSQRPFGLHSPLQCAEVELAFVHEDTLAALELVRRGRTRLRRASLTKNLTLKSTF